MSCAGGFEFPPEDEDATDAELELPDELLQWYHQTNRAAAAAQSKGKRKAPELSAFQRVGLKMEVELFIKKYAIDQLKKARFDLMEHKSGLSLGRPTKEHNNKSNLLHTRIQELQQGYISEVPGREKPAAQANIAGTSEILEQVAQHSQHHASATHARGKRSASGKSQTRHYGAGPAHKKWIEKMKKQMADANYGSQRGTWAARDFRVRAENPTLLSTNQLISMRYPLPGLPGETTLNIDTGPLVNAGFSAIFWLPHRLKRWTDKGVPTKPPCPTCGFHANVRSNGWTRGRRVFGVAHGIWLITGRWVCGKCKKRQAECTEKLREGHPQSSCTCSYDEDTDEWNHTCSSPEEHDLLLRDSDSAGFTATDPRCTAQYISAAGFAWVCG